MNLSIPELRKRNNFTIFRNRIRDNQSFTINESNGRTVRISNSVFRDITSVDDLVNNYSDGRSIVLPIGTTGSQSIRLTNLFKDSQFAGRTQNTTSAEDFQVRSVRQRLEELKDEIGRDFVPLRIGTMTHNVVNVQSTPGTPKSDFHFINSAGQMVGFVSHKDGSTARAIQQWGGMSAREPAIFSHSETQKFISDLQKMFPDGAFPRATTIARTISDPILQNKAVYGSNYGGAKGINNVDILLQGTVTIISRGNGQYNLQASGHTHNNGTGMTGTYEPVFMAIYKGDRSQAGLAGARTVISSRGGRSVTQWI